MIKLIEAFIAQFNDDSDREPTNMDIFCYFLLGGSLGALAGVFISILFIILIHMIVFMPMFSIGIYVNPITLYLSINLICICLGVIFGSFILYMKDSLL